MPDDPNKPLDKSLEHLRETSRRTVGLKQTAKALRKNIVKTVYIAEDAEEHLLAEIMELCRENDLPVVYVESMKLLGEACGINVGASVAAVLED